MDRLEVAERTPARSRRAAALALDVGVLLALLGVAALVAALWLLARTAWGRLDVGVGDAYVAAAWLGAVPPAWAAWQATRVLRDGRSFGQARLGLRIEGMRGRRGAARLAAHPLSLPLWGWLWLTLLLSGVPWLPWLAVLGALAVGAGGAVSAAMLLARPHRLPLHDRLAGTRLVRAP